MKLNYFQLSIIWLLIGIFGKIYDDAIDMYYIKHGTFILELWKLILTGLGLLILFDAPDIYTPLIIFSQFCLGPLVDFEAFLNDNYWCAISILAPVYAVIYMCFNFKALRLKYVLILFIFFNISGIPMMQSCVTLNGPMVDYVDKYFFKVDRILQFFDQSELNKNKLLFRVINVVWDVILIVYLEKFLFRYFNIQNDELFNICLSLNYFALGYSFVSVVSLAYNLYVDNIYERRKGLFDRRAERKALRLRKREGCTGQAVFSDFELYKAELIAVEDTIVKSELLILFKSFLIGKNRF